MTEYQTHAALVATLELEVSRLRAVNAELRSTIGSTSVRQRQAFQADWLELAFREGWRLCRDANVIGEEEEDRAFANSTANQRMVSAQAEEPQPARQPLTDAQVVIACSGFRRDFGRLTYGEQEHLCFQAREWDRAISKARGEA